MAEQNDNIYPVIVDYNRSVEDGVKAGNYDYSLFNMVSSVFKATRKGVAKIKIILVQFDRKIMPDEILQEFDKQGLRAAEWPELLAFGEKYPDIQRQFSIAALSAVWTGGIGDHNCVALDAHDDRRGVSSYWLYKGIGLYRPIGFGPKWRFAAVHK